MIKLLSPAAFDFGDPTLQFIKRSSRGLIGTDLAEFEKRASVDMLRSLDGLFEKVAHDEPLIHMLAVGSTEAYGPNRNGDGFRRRVCKQYHPTFEKFACFYRNHKNKDPRKSYGRVIKSAFNDPMQRIELVVALNGSEKAADRNKGLLADREMEKLANGQDIPVSMACKIPYDVCSYCGHEAVSPKEYCTKSACAAGGLREKIGALVSVDGGTHHLHADNPNPIFFDISNVFRPADRIAYTTGLLEKSASAGEIIKSASLAEELGISLPYTVAIESTQSPNVKQLVKTAYQLADIESRIDRDDLPELCFTSAFSSEHEYADVDAPPVTQHKFAAFLRACADHRIVLPMDKFMEIAVGCDREKAAEVSALTANLLPGIYSRMISNPDFVDKVSSASYAPAVAEAGTAYGVWAAKSAADFSLDHGQVERRIFLASLHGYDDDSPRTPLATEKIAAASEDSVTKLAEQYAMYKLACISAIPDSDIERQLTAIFAVVQNYAN